MRRIKQFILMLVCFVLTACTANKPEIRGSDLSEVDFVFRSSAAPVIEKMSNTQEPKNVRKVVKYDELRAVWLSYIDLAPMLTGKSEQEFTASFEAACRNISSLGCNTIFVHLRPFGDAIYRSELYPASRYITGRAGAETSFDPLEIMVKTAHSYKLSIHGWINPLRLESEDNYFLNWEPVDNASGYEIVMSEVGKPTETKTYYFSPVGSASLSVQLNRGSAYNVKIRALGVENYLDSDFSQFIRVYS